MAVREGLRDADGDAPSTEDDANEEKIVYVLHPNCAVEELGAGDRARRGRSRM